MLWFKNTLSNLLQGCIGHLLLPSLIGGGTAIMGYIQSIPISYIIFLVMGVIAFILFIISFYQENTVRGKLLNTGCQLVRIQKDNDSNEINGHIAMVFYNSFNKKIFFKQNKFKSSINKNTSGKEENKSEVFMLLPKQTYTILGPVIEHKKSEKSWSETEWEGVYGTSEKNMCYSLAVTREINVSKNNNIDVIDSKITKYQD